MAEYSDRIKTERQSSNVLSDYDKQFQQDLERAAALSLESLALEKFRQQKQKDDQQAQPSQYSRITNRSATEPPKINLPSSKPRPRPGSFNTHFPRILAPPPSNASRRDTSISYNENDLISFASISDISDIHKVSTTIPDASIQEPHSSSEQMVDKSLGMHRQRSHSSIASFQTFPISPSLFNPTNALALPYTQRTSSPYEALSEQLQVLKVVEKQDNNNLIDLTPAGVESTPESTARVSVLEAFDPLLTSENTQPFKNSSSQQSFQHEVPDSSNHSESSSFSQWEDSKGAIGPSEKIVSIPEDTTSECSGSVYESYDPFEYMYGQVNHNFGSAASGGPSTATTPVSPPPLPPRNVESLYATPNKRNDRRSKTKTQLYENVLVEHCKASHKDPELVAFFNMVKNLRAEFKYDDTFTNPGLVISPTIDSTCLDDTSIKLVVNMLRNDDEDQNHVTFTCDVNTSIDHVIGFVVCSLDGELTGTVTDFILKVSGLAEYLAPETLLAQYEYIHQCIKLEKDVILTLLPINHLQRPLARTIQDDNRDADLRLNNLLPKEPTQPLSHETLTILLDTLKREIEKVQEAASRIPPRSHLSLEPPLRSMGVVQAVKAICTLMGNIETIEIAEAIEAFVSICHHHTPQLSDNDSVSIIRPEIVDEIDDYCVVTLRSKNSSQPSYTESLAKQCSELNAAVQTLIGTYCHAFRVNFQLRPQLTSYSPKIESISLLEPFYINVEGLHRPLVGWHHDQYQISVQLYHGPRPIGQTTFTKLMLRNPPSQNSSGFDRIIFDEKLEIEKTISVLPLECRVVLVLYGYTLLPQEEGKDASGPPQMQRQELGWAALQLFDCERIMAQGSYLLPIWPPVADKRLGPAPAPGLRLLADTDPVLWVEIPEFPPSAVGSKIIFPIPDPTRQHAPCFDFSTLHPHTRHQLLNIIEQDTFAKTEIEDREVLWEKRHYLHEMPSALPKVLLEVNSWDWASLEDIYGMLKNWTPMEPVSALQLLLPCFPDNEVRKVAVQWIRCIGSDELVDYLPQLVQALKYETFEGSPLAHFLLERALMSPRVAHHLFWLLVQSLPAGDAPQNNVSSDFNDMMPDDRTIAASRYQRRLQLMLRSLYTVSGSALQQRFTSQQLLVKTMTEIAANVKETKESLRLKVLTQKFEGLHHQLEDSPTCLPLGPTLEVSGVQVRTCSYFPSHTLPLKINFLSTETGIIPAIFKVGDDLQQDMLTLQMIRIMDKLWLKEGLDLKMLTFSCVPTGDKRGMIEMVTSAETLRKIQVEQGLTGSFKDRPIAEWLAKHNPSAFEYQRAVDNFTASCAGYSVATYILGICDRHNDNIMLKTSGHLFHIDFGKFLGDAQMFGNFKRDRTPFVLTSDMAYVINGEDKPTVKFQRFVDLCCQAFNIVRKHGNLLLNLFGLMASSGISGVTMETVTYVQSALLPGLSNPEAAAMFARMIQSSLKSWFTQFNFFLHNLAQLRFTGDHNDGELLSFIPKTYTMQQEGRILRVNVHGYQKRYDPEKYYVYIIKVIREGQPDPSYLFRSYKEFCEFHQKLCILFPLAKCHSLPSGKSMGRSNIKQVAERRRVDVDKFLHSLFLMADEIAHSDLVYTFFHPLLRDQQDADINLTKVKEPKWSRSSISSEVGRVRGQLKLSLHYQRGRLLVMVHHARDLSKVAAGQEPSPYVKVYLRPDQNKETKRKTKVVRKNCHPTFMEMLEYRMSLDVIRSRYLQATVWNHDALQENEFLGGVTLPLSELQLTTESIEWYTLTNIHR